MSQEKWIFSIAVCFIVLSTASFALAVSHEGLVGHWRLNEGTGIVAKDSSPEGNDGELWGDATWATDEIRGTVLELPLNAGLNIPAQGVESLEQIAEAITLAAWIKITGPATDDQGNLIVKPGSYYLVYRDGKVGMYLYGPSSDGGIGYQTGKTDLPLNEWMHLALTYDRKAITLFVNGEVDFSGNADLPIATQDNEPFVGIGVERQETRFFQGFMDDVRMYNVALTEDQIRDIMDANSTPVESKGKLAMTWSTIKADR